MAQWLRMLSGRDVPLVSSSTHGSEAHMGEDPIWVVGPLDAVEHTQTIRQAVTLSQGYQKATMGRMSNLICLKHVKINNRQRSIFFGDRRRRPRDEMNISPACCYLLDFLSECEIGPFCGSIRNVVGGREEMEGVRRQKGLHLPRGGRERQKETK